jgi:hypothetical protein
LAGSAAVAVPFCDGAAGIADPSGREILGSLGPEYRDSSGAEYGVSCGPE